MQIENDKCEYCNRGFNSKKSLSNHRRWHKLPQYSQFQDNMIKFMRVRDKGKKYSISHNLNLSKALKGKKRTEITKKRLSICKLGENNPMWKGDEVQMTSLHNWIRYRKPRPEFCEKCNLNSPYDLANISGEYRRDVNDFEWLCRGCHMRKDGRINNLKKGEDFIIPCGNCGKYNDFGQRTETPNYWDLIKCSSCKKDIYC